jgi:uncharacterized membrane protein
MSLFNCLLALHIAGGTVALLSGPVPMLSRKGSRLHRRAGDIYAVAMMLTVVLALVLAAMKGNVLLLVIAVFSFFLVFSGVRAIAFRRGGRPSWADHGVCVLTVGFSLWLLGRGVTSGDITSLFFGIAGAALALRQLRLMRRPGTDWLEAHLSSMGGGYIATVTAFLVVNLTFLPQAVVFIAPTLIGMPIMIWAAAHRRAATSRQPPVVTA